MWFQSVDKMSFAVHALFCVLGISLCTYVAWTDDAAKSVPRRLLWLTLIVVQGLFFLGTTVFALQRSPLVFVLYWWVTFTLFLSAFALLVLSRLSPASTKTADTQPPRKIVVRMMQQTQPPPEETDDDYFPESPEADDEPPTTPTVH